ncbi:DgyrCDS12156 [Dimorphilus gyrociliatus]|uniref:DgyrCDS12156 n=1 Tax=Dimorphilus gyrociliatus TaxID=2664684 RepID=A0A7I8W7U2_9ANNE|nr:DgyrCDS12156 [Dimorphilus gyrociliatus]
MNYWSFLKRLNRNASTKYLLTCGSGLLAFVALGEKTRKKTDFDIAVENATDLVQRIKDESGCPGIVAAVGIDGQLVWSQGFGYANIEHRIECTPKTVMRIASISKSFTMALVGKLHEDGLLDYDQFIEKYVKTWPEKYFNGKPAKITIRQLLSHFGGIRHYLKCNQKSSTPVENELLIPEYYNKKRYKTISEALSIFKDDELCSLPGTEFLYTTYGWTLISAVLESVSSKSFEVMIKNLFQTLDLKNTYLDENDTIIYHRASNYVREAKTGKLKNAEYVDNSYKWGGGGLLSTAPDLVKFGLSMLSSYQTNSPNNFLTRKTMIEMWQGVPNAKCIWEKDGSYGMGWCIHSKYISHTGGSIGSSSVLLIVPKENSEEKLHGVSVAIMCNMQGVSLYKTAKEIAQNFQDLKVDEIIVDKQKVKDQDDLHDILLHTPRHDD